jgi:Winged helix-turn helix
MWVMGEIAVGCCATWPMPAAAALLINPDGLAELHRWARSAQLPAFLVQRARILLLAAESAANTKIAQRVGVSRPTVIACRRRYVRRGLEGLPDRPRPGRPQTVRNRPSSMMNPVALLMAWHGRLALAARVAHS